MSKLASLNDEQLEKRVAKQNRRLVRNSRYRHFYKILSERSVMRLRSMPGTIRAAAKMIAMRMSQAERKAA